MPTAGRPRLVSRQASATKLFVDDQREVSQLAQTERHTISDVIRELVHEALATRRWRARGREMAELPPAPAGAAQLDLTPVQAALRDIQTKLAQLAAPPHPPLLNATQPAAQMPETLRKLLSEVLGYSVLTESKTHLLLQHVLLSRGWSEAAVQALLAEYETQAQQHTAALLHQLFAALAERS